MESIKYYTPSIEDIRIGYEYQQLCGNPQDDISISESSWEKYKFPDPFVGDRLNIFKKVIETGIIRTPYLNKEQIEAEGWTNIDYRTYKKKTPRGNLIFTDCLGTDSFSDISREEKRSSPVCLFSGYIQSINEFRFISKLLYI